MQVSQHMMKEVVAIFVQIEWQEDFQLQQLCARLNILGSNHTKRDLQFTNKRH